MDTINYSANPANKIATSIFADLRIFDKNKYSVGRQFQILYKGRSLGIVEIKSIVCFHYEGERAINETTAFLAFAKPLEHVKKILQKFYSPIYEKTVLCFLSLEWITRDIEYQEALLKDWWQAQKEQHTPTPQTSFQF